MAGQDEADGVGADGAADGLGRHFGNAAVFGDLKSDGLVSHCLAKGDVFHDSVNFLLEG